MRFHFSLACSYVNKFFTKRINELSLDESDNILGYLFEHIAQNHDLTCRFRWQPGSLAIWDNVSLPTASFPLLNC